MISSETLRFGPTPVIKYEPPTNLFLYDSYATHPIWRELIDINQRLKRIEFDPPQGVVELFEKNKIDPESGQKIRRVATVDMDHGGLTYVQNLRKSLDAKMAQISGSAPTVTRTEHHFLTSELSEVLDRAALSLEGLLD